MISLICVYNNEEKLHNILKSSLEKQKGIEYELITVNSLQYGFKSAAEALNYGAQEASGDYLYFIHQDIDFQNSDDLMKLDLFCKQADFGIAGVAGLKQQNGKNVIYTNIKHGDPKREAGTHGLTQPIFADSLDECLLIVPKKIFLKNKFTDIGSTWHLYGTDYALKMKLQNQPVLIFPSDIWHVSDGKSLNTNYFDAIQWLARKYQADFKVINTIYGSWPTSPIKLFFKCWYRKIRFLFKGV